MFEPRKRFPVHHLDTLLAGKYQIDSVLLSPKNAGKPGALLAETDDI